MVTKHRKWSAASGSRSYPYFLTFLRYGPDFPTKEFNTFIMSKLNERHGLPSSSKLVSQPSSSVTDALSICVRGGGDGGEEGASSPRHGPGPDDDSGEGGKVIYMYARSPSTRMLN
eukprot:CAMPEP_0197567198 /NCGR_PEP_ID=MMETSP1320-20131121/35198_1 /TAXON_ID=91990 /ORGANISM="Bolidomonas sp., Strain RCC2347" /LENGTH=115 /DNA_ID=CAMNT_0043129357 /DNA_START=387 /DNA_END=731 /DNA_ORIENTATION=+